MNDRIPGSCYDNPIWYKGWRIYISAMEIITTFGYEFQHDSYDGAPDAHDNRYGYASSVEDAKAQIDTWPE